MWVITCNHINTEILNKCWLEVISVLGPSVAVRNHRINKRTVNTGRKKHDANRLVESNALMWCSLQLFDGFCPLVVNLLHGSCLGNTYLRIQRFTSSDCPSWRQRWKGVKLLWIRAFWQCLADRGRTRRRSWSNEESTGRSLLGTLFRTTYITPKQSVLQRINWVTSSMRVLASDSGRKQIFLFCHTKLICLNLDTQFSCTIDDTLTRL